MIIDLGFFEENILTLKNPTKQGAFRRLLTMLCAGFTLTGEIINRDFRQRFLIHLEKSVDSIELAEMIKSDPVYGGVLLTKQDGDTIVSVLEDVLTICSEHAWSGEIVKRVVRHCTHTYTALKELVPRLNAIVHSAVVAAPPVFIPLERARFIFEPVVRDPSMLGWLSSGPQWLNMNCVRVCAAIMIATRTNEWPEQPACWEFTGRKMRQHLHTREGEFGRALASDQGDDLTDIDVRHALDSALGFSFHAGVCPSFALKDEDLGDRIFAREGVVSADLLWRLLSDYQSMGRNRVFCVSGSINRDVHTALRYGRFTHHAFNCLVYQRSIYIIDARYSVVQLCRDEETFKRFMKPFIRIDVCESRIMLPALATVRAPTTPLSVLRTTQRLPLAPPV